MFWKGEKIKGFIIIIIIIIITIIIIILNVCNLGRVSMPICFLLLLHICYFNSFYMFMYFGDFVPLAYSLYLLCCVQKVGIKLNDLWFTCYMLILITIYVIVLWFILFNCLYFHTCVDVLFQVFQEKTDKFWSKSSASSFKFWVRSLRLRFVMYLDIYIYLKFEA